MMMKRIIVLCTLCFAVSVYCAESCPSNTVANGKSVQHKQPTIMQATNMSEVAWQILSGLERSIDVRCAILVVSVRQHFQDPINREYCKERLSDAELGSDEFQLEIDKLFSDAINLQREGEAYSEILKEITTYANKPRVRRMDTYRGMCRPFLTSPPTLDRYEFDQKEILDVRDLMSAEEKYRYMLLYAHFKTILASTFERYLIQDLKLDANGSVKVVWKEHKSSGATDAEINFLLSVITNKTLKVKSDITPAP